MNLMSSMAKTLVGSTMASVRVAPTRERGMTEYFWATSWGIRRRTGSSILKEVKVNGGNTVLPREHGRNHVVGNQSEFDQIVAKPATVFALIVQSFTQVLSTDEVLADENFA